ncbi:MAG: AmmeMemoRadiSam system protein B [Chloroflexi bacterium]|nr:AmmeMemoRadiSam system protein B [Chloroflexota bacterium]
MSAVTEIRPSPITGTWYEGKAERLARAVDGYIANAELPNLPGEVVAIIAPHAGHRYSGPVAGYAFATIKGCTPDVVAVVSPMHHPYPYSFITSAHSAYATPLGEIPVNRGLINDLDGRLKQRLGFGMTLVVNDPEHSLEIELPFLQRSVQSAFSLLPLMLRKQTREFTREFGEALAETLSGRNALLVASTDLSHFYDQATANRLDATMLAQVEAFSPDGIFDVEQAGTGEACGFGAVAAVLWAAKALGADTVKVLHHATSGDVTGDYHRVVGYGAAVVMKEGKK